MAVIRLVPVLPSQDRVTCTVDSAAIRAMLASLTTIHTLLFLLRIANIPSAMIRSTDYVAQYGASIFPNRVK